VPVIEILKIELRRRRRSRRFIGRPGFEEDESS
jgi:hypothetical protein